MSDWLVYRHEEAGLTLEHPPGWEAVEDFGGSVVVVLAPEENAEGFRANVGVTAETLPGATDLAAFTAGQIESMGRVLTDARLIDRSDATLLGRDGTRVLVAYRQGIHTLTLEQWWAVAGHDNDAGAVVVSATCAVLDYDSYADTFARLAASLRADDT